MRLQYYCNLTLKTIKNNLCVAEEHTPYPFLGIRHNICNYYCLQVIEININVETAFR